MKLAEALLLGCGALVGLAAATGGFTLHRIHQVDADVRREVALELASSDYERGAVKVRLAAEMRAMGGDGSEALRRQGVRMMADARERLASQQGEPVLRAQIAEMERVERLTTGATDALFATKAEAASVDPRVAQRLRFVQARADALSMGLEAFAGQRREAVSRSLSRMSAMKVTIAAIVGGSLALALAIAIVLGRRISAPILNLARGVRAVGTGNFDYRVEVVGEQELRECATGFNDMAQNLGVAVEAIERRTRDMSRVLDNVGQGLVAVDASGVMSRERSAALTEWLGPGQPGDTIWNLVKPFDAEVAASLECGFEAFIEDTMPVELTLAQMPKQLVVSGRALQFEYRPLMDGGRPAGLLVVMTDISERITAELAVEEQRAFAALIEHMLRDRAAVVDFIQDADALVREVTSDTSTDAVVLARLVHTLKGNASTYGLTPIAKLCHDLEEEWVRREHISLSESGRARLRAAWAHWTARLAVFLRANDGSTLSMSIEEYEELLSAVLQRAAHADLARLLARLRLDPSSGRLERLGDHAKALALRLEKAPLRVTIEHHNVRVPTERWHAFWGALLHVVRNAVDHGIESAGERQALGKRPDGHVTLRTTSTGQEICVELVDDGRGIDWLRVAEKASRKGIAVGRDDELRRLLFADGFSTRDEVTEISGRGVGLAAARAECERLGGRVMVESTSGRGTRFQFLLPAPELIHVEPRLNELARAS